MINIYHNKKKYLVFIVNTSISGTTGILIIAINTIIKILESTKYCNNFDEINIFLKFKGFNQHFKQCNVNKSSNNKVFYKFTLVCAISTKGLVGWTLYRKGGMTGERMCEFISTFIKNKFKKCLIIVDNGGPHKSKSINEIIKQSQNKLQYSVPYRPKTNAIESYFNQFKYYYKFDDKSIIFDELKKNVQLCLKRISNQNCKNYMEYAYKMKEPLST